MVASHRKTTSNIQNSCYACQEQENSTPIARWLEKDVVYRVCRSLPCICPLTLISRFATATTPTIPMYTPIVGSIPLKKWTALVIQRRFLCTEC